MYPICIQYVSHMYPICILYVPYMYPLCIQYVSKTDPKVIPKWSKNGPKLIQKWSKGGQVESPGVLWGSSWVRYRFFSIGVKNEYENIIFAQWTQKSIKNWWVFEGQTHFDCKKPVGSKPKKSEVFPDGYVWDPGRRLLGTLLKPLEPSLNSKEIHC